MNIFDSLISLFKRLGILFYLIKPKLFGIGYNQFKINLIKKKIKKKFFSLNHYIDERIVEIPWVIENLDLSKNKKILDAGCSLNFNYLIKKIIKNSNYITFTNIYPEKFKYHSKFVNYINEDITNLSFSKNYFDVVTCISVLEHVGFDNEIYNQGKKEINIKTNTELYKKALIELFRILKPGGNLYISIPFGKKMIFRNYQQFDYNEIIQIKDIFTTSKCYISFYKFENKEWIEVDHNKCEDSEAIFKGDVGISSQSVALLNIKK